MKQYTIDELFGSRAGSQHRVISFCGAGGKTSGIHALRDYFLMHKKKVLVTTTTHMFMEEGCVSDLDDIVRKLRGDGYAFAGTPVNSGNGAHPLQNSTSANPKITGLSNDNSISAVPKITGLANDVRISAEAEADVTLIEADGARHMPFKVPKPWEPVISDETTDVILVMGMDAVGKQIRDVCYNPEGVAESLRLSAEDILTREMMIDAYEKTYARQIRAKYGNIRIYLHMNEKIPGRSIIDDGLFLM